jgi:hypothetical protein
MFDSKTAAGYLPAQVSVIAVDGALTYSGLFVKRSLGKSWLLKSALTPSAYQTLFTQQASAGLGLAYVNAYTGTDGTPRLVALFAASATGKLVAKHGLTATALAKQVTTEEEAGYQTRAVAGYQQSGAARFIAYWVK